MSYKEIKKFSEGIKLHLATYFDNLGENTKTAFSLGTDSVHIDLVRAPDQLDQALDVINSNQSISLGLVDGRNIWINNLEESNAIAKKVVEKLGDSRVIIASSCQLLHTPVDLDSEKELDKEIKSWLSFAKQKLAEINAIASAVSGNEASVTSLLEINKKANNSRKISLKIEYTVF